MFGIVRREESFNHRPWITIWTRLVILRAVTSQPWSAATSSIAWTGKAQSQEHQDIDPLQSGDGGGESNVLTPKKQNTSLHF